MHGKMQDNQEYMQEQDERGLVKLSGSIEHVIYANEDNGYAICDFGTDDDELITIVGTMPYVAEGDRINAWGKWVHNPKYGRQFKVEQSEKQLPADKASMLRYLGSGTIKGIGPKTKEALLAHFKTVKRIKEASIEELENIIGSAKAKAVSEALKTYNN